MHGARGGERLGPSPSIAHAQLASSRAAPPLTLGAGGDERVVGNDVGGAALRPHFVKQLRSAGHEGEWGVAGEWQSSRGLGTCD